MVAITGQVARPVIGSEAFQECDICSIAAACTKMTYLVMSAQDLAPTIREAFRVAQEGRPGPVLIDIPPGCAAGGGRVRISVPSRESSSNRV